MTENLVDKLLYISGQISIDEKGELIKGTLGRKKNIASKTLDFKYSLGGKNYYISHKQRDGNGGGQSEAAHEAIKIAKYKCKDSMMCCIFEGKQNSNYQKYSQLTRINRLK